MNADGPEPGASDAREIASLVVGLAVVVVLAAACVLGPVAVAMLVRPWAGVPVVLGSFWVWGRFGPRSMPGFLSGIVCIWGYAAILGSLVVCVTLAIRG